MTEQADSLEEIKPTLEMIEAGVAAMSEFYENELYDETETVVQKVFQAMKKSTSKSPPQVPKDSR